MTCQVNVFSCIIQLKYNSIKIQFFLIFYHPEGSLSRTFSLIPWEFEIADIDCNYDLQKQLSVNNLYTTLYRKCFGSALNFLRALSIPGFWISSVLNIPWFCICFWFSLCQGFEYTWVLNMLGLRRVLSILNFL